MYNLKPWFSPWPPIIIWSTKVKSYKYDNYLIIFIIKFLLSSVWAGIFLLQSGNYFWSKLQELTIIHPKSVSLGWIIGYRILPPLILISDQIHYHFITKFLTLMIYILSYIMKASLFFFLSSNFIISSNSLLSCKLNTKKYWLEKNFIIFYLLSLWLLILNFSLMVSIYK